MDAWNTSFLLGWPIFRMLVSGRVFFERTPMQAPNMCGRTTCGRYMTWPKSMRPKVCPSSRSKMLPGCGSALKHPSWHSTSRGFAKAIPAIPLSCFAQSFLFHGGFSRPSIYEDLLPMNSHQHLKTSTHLWMRHYQGCVNANEGHFKFQDLLQIPSKGSRWPAIHQFGTLLNRSLSPSSHETSKGCRSWLPKGFHSRWHQRQKTTFQWSHQAWRFRIQYQK